MASPADREQPMRNSPSNSDSVSPKDVPEEMPPLADSSSTSGHASDSVSPEEQPSSAAACPTSDAQGLSRDDGSISDYAQELADEDALILSLSALLTFEGVDTGYVGDKESLSLLDAEDELGNIIELLQDKYSRFRPAKGDGNCFYRSFMFAYLEHLLETQDKAQFDSAIEKVEQCRDRLKFEDPDSIAEGYFWVFVKGLMSHGELQWMSNNRYLTNHVVFFLKLVVALELHCKADFYGPFIAGFEFLKLKKFCMSSVELLTGAFDLVRVKALTDALGVQLRIEHVVRSSKHSQLQHHDFQPSSSSSTAAAYRPPSITLLHRRGRFDILYP